MTKNPETPFQEQEPTLDGAAITVYGDCPILFMENISSY